MQDSVLVELKVRYAREQFLEPPLPLDDRGHLDRIDAWRRWDRACEEMVRSLAGAEQAAEFKQVHAPEITVDDPDRLIAVGASLVNTITLKVSWLDAFKVRLETRETLRELRS